LEDLLSQHGGAADVPTIADVDDFNWHPGDARRLWKALGEAAHGRIAIVSNAVSRLFEDLSFRSDTTLAPKDTMILAAAIGRSRAAEAGEGSPPAKGYISFGTVLALDDMAGTLAAETNFLRVRDGSPITAWVPVADLGIEFAGRYFDYRKAARLGSSQIFGYLSRRLPLLVCRIGLLASISELALMWIAAHEAAHAALGHFSAVRQFGLRSLKLGDGAASPRTPPLSRRDYEGLQCLEMQADWLALAALLVWAYSDSAAANYPFVAQSTLRDIDTDSDRTGALDPRIRRDRLRIVLLAAIAALMTLERRAVAGRMAGSTHPIPSSRILNLVVCAHTVTEELIGRRSGGRECKLKVDGDSFALDHAADLEAMSGALSVGPTPERNEAWKVGRLLEDIAAVLEGRASKPSTKAGQVYFAMVARSRKFGLEPSHAMGIARSTNPGRSD
jgi:hypothetical protein